MRNDRTDRRRHRSRRRVEHALSLDPVFYVADGAAGRLDRGAPAGPDGTAWEQRLLATYRENDQRILARTADALAREARELREQYGHWVRLGREIDAVEARIGELPEPVLAAVGNGERHLDEAAIKARRLREHDAALGALQDEARRLRDERSAVQERCVTLRATVAEEFELACEVSERLRWFYTRRRATYTRARQRAGRATPLDVTTQAAPLPTAAWTTQPCPWVPAGFDRTITMEVEADVR
ncbi:hypothetical protein [Cellulomonas composti]|uniref:Uncharacterized protein n=1 Tax=Cellulomonas composti TaxID=266130 RepID=A0A511JD92_9CELL|nr:hypothetical protein [Cellulomonas composti]GEL95968.1 hypothetical protein CCO02nite_26260 [Cellulomonas composti]